jgi:hypothetical protein
MLKLFLLNNLNRKMDKLKLLVNDSIIKIIGIFESENKKNELHKFLEKNHFKNNPIEDDANNTHKNLWYPEFRNMFILEKGQSACKIYHKEINQELTFFLREGRETKLKEYLDVSILNAELFTFKEGLHFFSIEASIKQKELMHYSDLTFTINKFNSKVIINELEIPWVNWIESNVLAGIKIASTEKLEVKVDDYSGSKFKLFAVLDLAENIDSISRDELLYDIGCSAKIGSAGGNEYHSPSQDYYLSLLKNKISVFNNYAILPLFDSVTVIGHHIIESQPDSYKRKTWSQSYFRIILYNLFIKYNLFRYNSELHEESNTDKVELRDKFEKFLNYYNLSHISYNFLPNLIFHSHKKSLDIENELQLFQKRIVRISESIKEEQQKRSNSLLGIVGIFTSIGAVKPVYEFVEHSRATLNMHAILFYCLVAIILILLAIPVLIYLFPQKYKLIKLQWKNKKNSF